MTLSRSFKDYTDCQIFRCYALVQRKCVFHTKPLYAATSSHISRYPSPAPHLALHLNEIYLEAPQIIALRCPIIASQFKETSTYGKALGQSRVQVIAFENSVLHFVSFPIKTFSRTLYMVKKSVLCTKTVSQEGLL